MPHDVVADDLLEANFLQVYGCMLFLSIIQRVNKQYYNLLNSEQGDGAESSPFMARWGWIYSTKQVADFNNITVNEAYDLRVRE